jgi:rhomboid protease GluP
MCQSSMVLAETWPVTIGGVDNRRMCPNCRAFITTDDKICPYCDLRIGARAVDQRSPADVLGGLIPHHRFTTVMIMLVNTGMYIATVLYTMRGGHGGGFDSIDTGTLLDFGAKYSYAIFVLGQYWRLITAGFLHAGLLHIGMNMWVLFDLGVQVEEVYGTSRYLVLYLLATVGGFLASAWWAPSVPSIGASAGIFGLIGAMIALGVRDRSAYGAMIRSMYTRWAIYGLAFGILPSLFGISFMDNAAHIGGVTTGFVVAYIAGTPRLSSRAMEGFWRVAAGIALGLTAFSFLEMFLWLTSPHQ